MMTWMHVSDHFKTNYKRSTSSINIFVRNWQKVFTLSDVTNVCPLIAFHSASRSSEETPRPRPQFRLCDITLAGLAKHLCKIHQKQNTCATICTYTLPSITSSYFLHNNIPTGFTPATSGQWHGSLHLHSWSENLPVAASKDHRKAAPCLVTPGIEGETGCWDNVISCHFTETSWQHQNHQDILYHFRDWKIEHILWDWKMDHYFFMHRMGFPAASPTMDCAKASNCKDKTLHRLHSLTLKRSAWESFSQWFCCQNCTIQMASCDLKLWSLFDRPGRPGYNMWWPCLQVCWGSGPGGLWPLRTLRHWWLSKFRLTFCLIVQNNKRQGCTHRCKQQNVWTQQVFTNSNLAGAVSNLRPLPGCEGQLPKPSQPLVLRVDPPRSPENPTGFVNSNWFQHLPTCHLLDGCKLTWRLPKRLPNKLPPSISS